MNDLEKKYIQKYNNLEVDLNNFENNLNSNSNSNSNLKSNLNNK